MNSKPPLISVVTATYNRSNILYFSLSLLQRQDFSAWECIIVGDACTDDTETVVNSFDDERFRFINFKENFGEQSGPNNYGVSLARGTYIAFLNHDDLWFPDHLSSLLEKMEKSDSGLVYAMSATVFNDDRILVKMIHEACRYEPNIFVPASTWLFRKDIYKTVGPWRSFKETHATPSQDWLFRAWRQKCRMEMNPVLTAILVFSGWRKNSYLNNEAGISEKIFNAIVNDPEFREKIILDSLISSASGDTSMSFRKNIKVLLRGIIYKFLIRLGLSPSAVLNFLKYGIHGGFIQFVRVHRGLKKKKK